MKTRSKILSLLLCAAMMLGVLSASALAAPTPFTDVKDTDWFYDEVRYAYEKGLMNGTGANTFSPNSPMNRAMAATILYRQDGLPEVAAQSKFADVPAGTWYTAAVAWAVANGVVGGYSADSFGPADNVTRKDLAAMFSRYAEYKNMDIKADEFNKILETTDGAQNGQASRAQAAALLKRLGEAGAIASVKAIGFVDADGAKLKAIAVEYKTAVQASSVSLEDFEIENYSLLNPSLLQEGAALGKEAGVAKKVYVNDEPKTVETGKDSGKYVIIEVNTDYLLSSVPQYTAAMIVGVKQVGELTGEDGVISANAAFIRNYTESEAAAGPMMGGPGGPGGNGGNGGPGGDGGPNGGNGGPSGPMGGGMMMARKNYTLEEGSYAIEGIEDYELHYMASDAKYNKDYPAFLATNCFEEASGESVDVELPYALFVPKDYDASKKYALVLHILDAGSLGTDPMIVLTEGQAPANYASDEVQKLIKDQGLGGIIVVAPSIDGQLRTTRDNWTTSAAVPATWQLMDSLTEKYNIDMGRIYGTGQSMGGMQVMAMAGQRDNYFAGLWMLGMQWGNNYNKEVEYNGASYYASTDPTIWTKDDDGNDSDYGNNWYYLLSDDNVLFTNCVGDSFSCLVWNELDNLYQDIAGVEIPKTAFNPLDLTVEQQNAKLRELLAVDSGAINYHWQSFDGGSHMLTWVYGHRLDAGYEWLLKQTRQSERDRAKLANLNRPWAAETDTAKIAAKQTEARKIGTVDGKDAYLAVPAEGAGTKGYNSTLYGMGGGSILKLPGWTAEK